MQFFVFLVMWTVCMATPQDLSGKVFVFPEESQTSLVKLEMSATEFSAITVCFRSFTDLSRNHALFSLATPGFPNAFLIFKAKDADKMNIYTRDKAGLFSGQEYKLNTWHSICGTWDAASGLGELWLDGKPGAPKFFSSGSNISGTPVTVLGQEQDSHGGGFDVQQSFVGMITNVHVWDYVLSPCEIQRYTDSLNFTPGNVINWRALEYKITGRVLVENEKVFCD